ncbi:DUF4423 domain-containing protein [Bdellovibrio sp. NC01]|uniref:DUF4423 domain-containing protein n=1 Tax=Bdellovibrio sp. NC01 TaxID=2220073 RepID=UPI00115C030D|nr:hypothetical protein [Bdellovibrio sp. NC01]
MKKFSKSIEVLQHDYQSKREKNPAYSKRAYAKALGISSGRLVDLLNERIPLTMKTAVQISERIFLSDEDRALLFELTRNEQYQRLDGRRKTPALAIAAVQDTRRILANAMSLYDSKENIATEFNAVTFAFDKQRITEARALIQQLQYKLASLSEEPHASDTYCLSVQLFPADQDV